MNKEILKIYYLLIKAKAIKGLGNVSLGMIAAGMVLLAAYMMYPEVFYSFFKFIREQVFENLNSSFGNDPFGGEGGQGKNKNQGGK